MPTPGERKALLFFAALFALGGGVQVWRARQSPPVVPQDGADTSAFNRQVAAADAAHRGDKKPKGRVGKGAKSTTRDPQGLVMPIPEGLPPELAVQTMAPGLMDRAIAIPPTPPKRSPRTSRGRAADPSPQASPAGPLDVDQATETALEALPKVGPALAKRIVADRATNGPFGSLDGLSRVKGIGPALRASLAPLVTFSGTPRP